MTDLVLDSLPLANDGLLASPVSVSAVLVDSNGTDFDSMLHFDFGIFKNPVLTLNPPAINKAWSIFIAYGGETYTKTVTFGNGTFNYSALPAVDPSTLQPIPTPAALAEWQLFLSRLDAAKGDKGDTGDRGPKGDTGPAGIPGVQGIQGLKGDKGDKGDTGAAGPVGADSIVPGPQGIQGVKGDKGDTGAAGPAGADSIVPGPQGIQGVKGDTGAQGIQGVKGDTGAQGIQGVKGDTGAQGIQGVKGDTGPAGPTGPAAVGETVWTTAALKNGFGGFGSTFTPGAQYRKDGQGVVHVRVMVNMPSGSNSLQTVFTMPVGYRPGVAMRFNAIVNDTNTICNISPNGDFAFLTISASQGGWGSAMMDFYGEN